jgi:uncharacterized membrane protein (DUF2068 family)
MNSSLAIKRPRAFTATLLLLAAGNLAGLSVALFKPEVLTTPHPRLLDVWNVYMLSPILTLVGLWGMWRLRRWGAWVVAATTVGVLGLELYAMGPTVKVGRIPLAAALLVLVTRPAWRSFR